MAFFGEGNVVFTSEQTKFLILSYLDSHKLECIGFYVSSEPRPTFWSCYANISVFIDRIRNQFLKK